MRLDNNLRNRMLFISVVILIIVVFSGILLFRSKSKIVDEELNDQQAKLYEAIDFLNQAY